MSKTINVYWVSKRDSSGQEYEFRRLDSPGVSFVAAWLHGKSDDIIIPLVVVVVGFKFAGRPFVTFASAWVKVNHHPRTGDFNPCKKWPLILWKSAAEFLSSEVKS